VRDEKEIEWKMMFVYAVCKEGIVKPLILVETPIVWRNRECNHE